jgi:hypothetical protein
MSSLKEQNGKYYQQCKVVMLATENKSTIYLDLEENKTGLYNKPESSLDELISQHLYILSDEEIKEGDWCLEGLSPLAPTELIKVTKEDLERCIENYNYGSCKKIIATTDQWLELKPHPNVSQSFIKKFIEEYNKGNVIEDVLVEYEFYNTKPNSPAIYGKFKERLKVDSDNTITIKKVKDTYSREEVLVLLKNCWQQATRKTLEPLEELGFTSFIKENL